VTNDQLDEIAKIKMKDLNARDVEHARRIIAGTARSCGIEVVDVLTPVEADADADA
ncbi:MAG: hypothetical protein GY704_06305, partial [Phycisphaeraceae bacterium]|nr:hypothetical protein [Phycisphaeraceae bacterium]